MIIKGFFREVFFFKLLLEIGIFSKKVLFVMSDSLRGSICNGDILN